jgi:hypothetical protein
MNNYFTNVWIIALIVLVNQFAFLYLRTKNVYFIAHDKILLSILTGMLLGISWLVSAGLSIDAIFKLQWQPIIGYLLGGALGTYYAMIRRKKEL